MEASLSQEPTGSEIKAANAGAISAGRTSRKKEKISIDLNILLRIVQQALHNYQEAGGEILIPDVGNVGTAFVLVAVDMDDVGNLIRKSANNDVGNIIKE